MEFKYAVLILSLLLLIFLLYKEIKRASKARLLWRIFASIIAVSCFALLIIPVKYKSGFKNNANEIILLTKGADLDELAKIRGAKYVLGASNAKVNNAVPIPDLSYFLANHKDVRKLNIYGEGLSKHELRNLHEYELNFHPSEGITGIISASWPAQIKSTQQLLVQGIYQNKSEEKVKLLFKGMGSSIDSISVEGKSSKSFSFSTQPKQIGKAVYNLISFDGKDTLAKEPVPFLVDEQLPFKVLILASFPDFEYKFLKKWLYDNHYPLAFRSQISKDKYSSEFLAMDSINLNKISTNSIKKFDILIIDEEELAAMNAGERSAIDAAVTGGMGLFIRVSSLKALTPASSKFGRFEVSNTKEKELKVMLKDEKHKFSSLPLEQKLFLRSTQNDLPLLTDGGGKVLVNSTIKGAGKVLVSSLPSTFNWLLTGKKNDFTTYWSTILSAAVKKRNENQSLKILPQFPVVNEKARLIVDIPTSGKIPSLNIDSIRLTPLQNIELPFEWEAVFYPTKNGWHNLVVNQSAEPFFIYQKTDWQALKIQQKILATRQFVAKAKIKESKIKQSAVNVEEELSIWWFFVGFLLASAFLWFEARILDAK
ncbi:hypothetical protein [Pedobacter sp. Leaf194]|uniref:hypothetical protein n=1 Tax=Pedobacter sp. Leaf194 TaxID=1736297 RepID=UPI000702D1E4|nr:hypothetical protein [Pedobacter sp. Leaf194]KQS37034.1 hypothetical protein ASG14_08395 [Pedobacter sp. Leaf194]